MHPELFFLLGGEDSSPFGAAAEDPELRDLEDLGQGQSLSRCLPPSPDQGDRGRPGIRERSGRHGRGSACPVRTHEVGLDQRLERPVQPEDRDQEPHPSVRDRIGLEAGDLAAGVGGEHPVQQAARGECPPAGHVLRLTLAQLAHRRLD